MHIRSLSLSLALLFGCVGHARATEPAVTPNGEQLALLEIASSLEERVGPQALDERGAALARALAYGRNDADTHNTAVAVLLSLRDRPEPIDSAPPSVIDAILSMSPEARSELAERLVDAGVTELGPPVPPPVEVPQGRAADDRALSLATSRVLAEGRTALRAGEYEVAVSLLRPVREQPSARPFWQEAVDAYVFVERERAGALYQQARGLRGSDRRAQMQQARDLLDRLISDYPGTVYREPLVQALGRVERNIDALPSP